jgi:hypothetical protein
MMEVKTSFELPVDTQRTRCYIQEDGNINTVLRTSDPFVGIDVSVPVFVKDCLLWDITPCRLLRISDWIRGTCLFHARREELAKQETSLKQVAKCGFLLDPDDGNSAFL